MLVRILITLTVCYVLFVALASTTVATVLWALRRRNRVAATVKTPAPVSWLVSPRAPARMHRRLRNAMTSARVAYAPEVGDAHPQLHEMCRTLEREAVLTDERLVAASSTPRPHRRQSLRPLQAQVGEIERLAHQIAHTARRAGPSALPQAADGLREVADQLSALHAAQLEIDHVERVSRGEHPDITGIREPAHAHLPPPPAPDPVATTHPAPPLPR